MSESPLPLWTDGANPAAIQHKTHASKPPSHPKAKGAGVFTHRLPSYWRWHEFSGPSDLPLTQAEEAVTRELTWQREAAAGRRKSGCVYGKMEAQGDVVKVPPAAARAFQAEGTPRGKALR